VPKFLPAAGAEGNRRGPRGLHSHSNRLRAFAIRAAAAAPCGRGTEGEWARALAFWPLGRSGIASCRHCCADARELLRAARVFRNTLACSHTERRLRRGMRDKVDARE
jgi:hypothetical protein